MQKICLRKQSKIFKRDIDNFDYGKYDLIISNPPYINSNRFKIFGQKCCKF